MFLPLCIYCQGASKFFLAGELRPYLGGSVLFSHQGIPTYYFNGWDTRFTIAAIKYFYAETPLSLLPTSPQEQLRELMEF